MKLIIDIPEEVKNRLCFGVTYPEDIQVVCEALNDGTPLDKISAEISAEIEQMDFDFGDFYDHTSTIREMVLGVIDKYKAESEDKE